MQVIKRCPRTEIHPEVALFKGAPDALAVWHAADITLAPLRVVLGVGIGTELQLADHILHALAALVIARSGIDGHCRQIVTAHMAVQSVPVGIGLCPRLQARLLAIGCQQTVAVVLQQRPYVQVTRPLQRTVQQGYIAEGKFVGIQLVLCVASYHSTGQHPCHQEFFHFLLFQINSWNFRAKILKSLGFEI